MSRSALAALAVAATLTVAPRARSQARPELVLQTGPTTPLLSLTVTADGRTVATTNQSRRGTGEATVRVWDAATGRQLRTLGIGARGRSIATFSPDGSLLAAGTVAPDEGYETEEDNIRVWDVRSGRELHRFFVPRTGGGAVVISRDNRYLVALPPYIGGRPGPDRAGECGKDFDCPLESCPNVTGKPGLCEADNVSVWDLATGRWLYNIPIPPSPSYTWEQASSAHMLSGGGTRWYAEITPDSRTLALSVLFGRVLLIDLATGRDVTPAWNARSPFVIDPRGRVLASYVPNGSTTTWDLRTFARVRTYGTKSIPLGFSSDGARIVTNEVNGDSTEVEVWNTTTGTRLRRLTMSNDYVCMDCTGTVSPDARWLVRGGWQEPRLDVWDLEHPARAPRLWYGINAPLSFGAKGQVFGTFASDVWSFDPLSASQACFRALPLPPSEAVALMRAPGTASARWLATTSFSRVALWDAQSGILTGTLSGHDDAVTSLVFDSSANRLVSAKRHPLTEWGVGWVPGIGGGGSRSTIRWADPACTVRRTEEASGAVHGDYAGVWDVDASRLAGGVAGATAPMVAAPDGSWIATAAPTQHLVRIWSQGLASLLRVLDDSVPGLQVYYQDQLGAVAVNATGTRLASALEEHSPAIIWNTRTWTREAVLTTTDTSVTALAWNPRDGTLVSAGFGRQLRVWNVDERRLVRSWSLAEVPEALAFRPAGDRLAAAVGRDVIEFDDSGREVRRLTGHTNTVKALAFSPDGALLFSSADDGSTRVWNDSTGTLLATLLVLNGGADWLVVSPDGLFDGSPPAWQQILWRFNNNTFDVAPVEPFFRDYYHPGLLAQILAGERPRARTDLNRIDRRQPDVEVRLVGAERVHGTARRDVEVRVAQAPGDTAHASGSGVRDVRLFRNGTLVRAWHGAIPLDARGRATLVAHDVAEVAGVNRYVAYAFSNSDIKSSDAVAEDSSRASPRKGIAYILAIGIDDYADPALHLDDATADATSFAASLADAQRKLARFADVRVVRLLDTAATKSRVLQELRKVESTQPEDAVFVFFAGHGASSRGADRRYYLIARDFDRRTGMPGLRRGAEAVPGTINDVEIGAAMERIGASELVMVIDACQSGRTVESDDPRQGPMNATGLAQLAYDKGMYILAAAQGDQAAKELTQLGHGLLTYALVQEGLDAHRADDAPPDGEIQLREWLDYAVARVPQLQADGMERAAGRGVSVSVVPGDEARDPRARRRQRPRVFYRRDREPQPFVIARPGTGR